jgi:hypothetical protein
VSSLLKQLDAALTAFVGVYGDRPTRKRRKMSAKSRGKIAAAQRARWAKVNGQEKVVPIAKSGKRTMSASARRKIAAAQRKRWVKFRQKGKVCPEFCVNDRVLFSGMGCWGRGHFPFPSPSL